jgi:hypothetical protein
LGGLVDDELPNVDLFKEEVILDYLEGIASFLTIRMTPNEFTIVLKKHLVSRAAYYHLIIGQLYKLGIYGII